MYRVRPDADRRIDANPERAAAWRWLVAITALVREGRGCAVPITVVDLSRTGCRIDAGFRLTVGSTADLRIDRFAPFRSRIAWAAQGQAGLHFDQPLHPAVLAHLVALYPSDAALPRAPDQSSVITSTAPSLP